MQLSTLKSLTLWLPIIGLVVDLSVAALTAILYYSQVNTSVVSLNVTDQLLSTFRFLTDNLSNAMVVTSDIKVQSTSSDLAPTIIVFDLFAFLRIPVNIAIYYIVKKDLNTDVNWSSLSKVVSFFIIVWEMVVGLFYLYCQS